MAASVFSKIIAGELAADIIWQDEHCIVIHDIHPQAPVHLLVIPKKPLVSLADAQQNDQALLGHLLLIAADMARKQGIEDGFRLVANNGKAAGQTVFHLHFHVMGGRRYSEATLNQGAKRD